MVSEENLNVKQLVVNKANSTVRCPRQNAMSKVATCVKCVSCYHGIEYNAEEKFVILCSYTKQTPKEKIIAIIGSASDFHPNSLGALADKILEAIKEEE